MQISVLFIENIVQSGNGKQAERERGGEGMAYAARAFVVSLNNIYNAGRCWQSISRGIRQGNQYGNLIEFKTDVKFA